MNEEINNNIDNATPLDGGSISPSTPPQEIPKQEEPKLKEEDRMRLDGIVKKAIANKESDETINFIVKDFKNKYGVRGGQATQVKPQKEAVPPAQKQAPISVQPTQPKPEVSQPTEQPVSGEALEPKIDSNPKEVQTPQLKVGKPEFEGIAPERPTTYQGLPIKYGETDDSGVVDFGNGIALPVGTLPKEEKTKPTIQVGKYISSLGPDGKQSEDITGQTITKDAENQMYESWQSKGWGKIVKVDEQTGRAIFAPNEEGRAKIKQVYEQCLGYDKPLKAEQNEFSNYVADIQKKYGVLLTNEERSKLSTKEGRDSLEIELQAKELVKQNPNLSYDQAVTKIANEYQLNSNEKARDLASNFFTERLSQMRWGRDEDNAKEAEWIKSTMKNQDMLQQFGRFLQSDDGKMYATSTNKFLSTMTQKDMKDVVNSFFQYMGKENMINTDANVEQYKDTQAALLNAAKAGDGVATQALLNRLNEDGQKIRNNDTQSQNLFLQQQAINEVFTEANYWEDKAGEYYGDVENGKRTVENVINGSATMATNAIKRTAGGILSVFLSPMTMMGDENKQDYYDLIRALGKPLEMKGVKLHDAFYTQEVGHDEAGIEYVRLNDGKVYQRSNGNMSYLQPDEYDPRDITWDKTEHEWTASGIANAVQSFGWDVYMANGIGGALTKPIAAMSEYAAISNATKNLATAGTVIGEETAVTRGLVNFTRAMRSPHTATNAGFFAQMYQDNLIKAKDAGIDSDLGASLYATVNSAFDSFLISKVVPEFKMRGLNNQVRTITRNLAENRMASASQGIYNFLKETAPSMAHTYLTMLAIETKTKLTDQNLNQLTDSHFNIDNSESIFASSAKGALPLVLFSLISKSPMLMMRNKAVLNDQFVDLSKMDRDEIMVSLARQGDHIFPMLKNEAQNAYFKAYGDEVNAIADKIKAKQDLLQKVPNYEKYSDSELTRITDLMELKNKKQQEADSADEAFKVLLKGEIKNIDKNIQEIADAKSSTSTSTRSQESTQGSEGQAINGETTNKETKTLIKDAATVERLKNSGVPDEVINALPADFHINDKYLMGDKGENLMERLRKTMTVGGISFNQVKTENGQVTEYNNGRVDLNKTMHLLSGGKDHHTFHEAVHGATVIAIQDIKAYNELPESKRDGRYTDKQRDAVDSLDFFTEYMSDKLKSGEIKAPKDVSTYGLSNSYEFVAEFMSNKKFREWVLTSEYEAGIRQSKNQNILKSIYDKILTVIGLKAKDKDVIVKDMDFQKSIQTDINNLLDAQRRVYDRAEYKKEIREKTENTRTEQQTEKTKTEPVSEEKQQKIDEINSRRDAEIDKLDEPIPPLKGVTENYDRALEEYRVKEKEFNDKWDAIDEKYDREIEALDKPSEPRSEKDFNKIDLSESLGINKANDFLDNLDKKLDDFGKDNLGINIPVVVLRGAVAAMRGAVKSAKFGADVISAGMNHVRETSWYKKLSEEERKQFEEKGLLSHFDDLQNKKAAEAVVKSETIGKEKPVKTQVRESSGQTDTSKKTQMSEKTLLKEKFKNLQRGFKTGAKETQQFKKEFIDQLKGDLKGLGKEMNQSEMNAILNQVGKINDKNIDAVESVVNKVIERIEARQDRKEMSALKKQLKNLGKSKGKSVPRNIRDLAQDATIIDERYLSPKSKEEYKSVLDEIRGAFRPNSSDLYQMVDEAQAMKKLAKLYEEADRNKVEELATLMGVDATGLTNKEIKDLWTEENADVYAESLAEAKQKAARDAFINQAEYARMGLDFAETTDMTNKEKRALKVLKDLDFKTLPLEMIKQYVKIADNIVVNKDFSNAGAIVAKVKADKGINDLVGFINAKGINPKRIDRTQTGNSFLGVHVPSVINPLEWVKAGVDYMTTLNVYMDGVMGGAEGGAKLYNDTGFFDMSNARIRATVRKTNFDNYYQGTIDKLAKSNPSITEGKEVVKRSIFATLLQADQGSKESMDFFKKSYIEKSVKSLEAYSANKNAEAKMKILNETLDALRDVNTKEELIDYLKTKEKDNYKLLRAASDYFLRHSQEFSDNSYFNHGERFDPRTAEDFYLPLSRSSLINKSMRTKVDEVKGTVASSFNRPSQAMSGSVFTRERMARLQESETINFDFDSMISNKYGEQIYDIESAQDILRMKSALTHPEMKRLFGPTLASLTDKALDKIAIDSGVAMNSTTEVEKNIIKVERTIRKIASVNALGGVDQYLKQYPSVLIGAGIRLGRDAGLLSRYMFMDKSQVELLKMSSIRLRGEAEAGIKRVSDDVKFTELSVKEKNEVEKMASKLATGLGIGLDKARELSMYSLRKGDTNAATTTFLAYYHSYLLKHGVKESDIDMRLEHAKIENDPVRKNAVAYAQHMINTTQTSSDLSEGSKMATSPHVMAKIMSGVLIPFSSFSNNAMVRLAKAVGNINRGRKENLKEVAASLTEIVAFQSIKALAIAPAAAIIGNVIFGGDKKDEEDVIDWEFQVSKAASGVVGDLNPTPDSFDIDALNYMIYLKNRDAIKKQYEIEGDFTYRDYDIWRKKVIKAGGTFRNGELPYHFYRFGDQDGWDIANGSKSDIGMYDIPKKQAERTVEAWDVLLDKKTEGYNQYGKKEKFDFGNEHDNLLLFYTLYETAAIIGLSDATSRRIIEKEYDKIKRQSKEKKAKKRGSGERREKSDDYGKL